MFRTMFAIERTIQVKFHHRVLFVDRVFDPGKTLLRDILSEAAAGCAARALVVMDGNLAAARPGLAQAIGDYFTAHQAAVRLVCPPLVMPGGEKVKASLAYVAEVHAQIERHHIDRHAYVIGIGGGALLDMVGFAAATAHRGCRHVRLPTTTLSQADSGVGIKNGVNAFGKKNFVGTFTPPFAVINDFELLSSLPPREMRAGFVEAVKVALIHDRDFFDTIEREVESLVRLDRDVMQRLIRRCAELHVNHIATCGDPFERGSARPLDFGHWAAHKLEQLTEWRMSHGEAVATGLAIDTVYARRRGYLPAAAAERILAVLRRLGFRLYAEEMVSCDVRGELSLLSGLEEFREHLGGDLTLTMLRDIGLAMEVHEVDRSLLRESFFELRTLESRTLAGPGSPPVEFD